MCFFSHGLQPLERFLAPSLHLLHSLPHGSDNLQIPNRLPEAEALLSAPQMPSSPILPLAPLGLSHFQSYHLVHGRHYHHRGCLLLLHRRRRSGRSMRRLIEEQIRQIERLKEGGYGCTMGRHGQWAVLSMARPKSVGLRGSTDHAKHGPFAQNIGLARPLA